MSLNYSDTRAYIQQNALEQANYGRAYLLITGAKNFSQKIEFLINPMSLNLAYGNTLATQKTASGWLLARQGKNLVSVSFNGVLVDAYGIEEKQYFLEQYKQKCVDQQNGSGEYFNDYYVTLYVEGVKYQGYINSLNMSKSSSSPIMYQYSINFIGMSDTFVQHSVAPSTTPESTKVVTLSSISASMWSAMTAT